MYVLEHRERHVIAGSMTRNRECEAYRWKQMALCDTKDVFVDFIKSRSHPSDYRISEMPDRNRGKECLWKD